MINNAINYNTTIINELVVHLPYVQLRSFRYLADTQLQPLSKTPSFLSNLIDSIRFPHIQKVYHLLRIVNDLFPHLFV